MIAKKRSRILKELHTASGVKKKAYKKTVSCLGVWQAPWPKRKIGGKLMRLCLINELKDLVERVCEGSYDG